MLAVWDNLSRGASEASGAPAYSDEQEMGTAPQAPAPAVGLMVVANTMPGFVIEKGERAKRADDPKFEDGGESFCKKLQKWSCKNVVLPPHLRYLR